MTETFEIAYAKINLALHVRRRGDDGYHSIETLFAFAEDGDLLHLTNAPGLTVSGPFAAAIDASADNLVERAARGFAECTGVALETGFHLEKRLPVAAGIGGGSADAAAALRLLCTRHATDLHDPRIEALARALGADVPACLFSRPMRGTGRGDRLTPVASLAAGQPLLLVNPGQMLATSAVFRSWDGVDRGPLPEGDPMAAAFAGRNDLEPPAIALAPVIGEALALLREQPGARFVRMSGSGATCFGLFDDVAARDAAARSIAVARSAWWLLATRLR